mgnify:CR=1 FL=1
MRRVFTGCFAGLVMAAQSVLAQDTAATPQAQDGELAQLKIIATYSDTNEEDSFLKGIRLATKQVNENGGMLGKSLVLETVPVQNAIDESAQADDVDAALRLAKRISAEPDLFALVGHSSSSFALPASSVYQDKELLFLTTNVTDGPITNLQYDLVFMLTPNNREQAASMAKYALSEKLNKFIVLSDRSEFAQRLTSQFEEFLTVSGGTVEYQGLVQKTAPETSKQLLFLLDNKLFKTGEIDAIFIGSSSQNAMFDFIKQARGLGLDIPIFGPEALFSEAAIKEVGAKAMKDVIAVSLYEEDDTVDEVSDFVAQFQDEYGHKPDQESAIAFDAINLLAFGVSSSKSFDSKDLASFLSTMRYRSKFNGATGNIAFDRFGRIVDTKIYVVRYDGEAFRTVATQELPIDYESVGQIKCVHP